MFKTLLTLILAALPILVSAATTPAASTNAPSTNGPAATPPATVAAGDIVTQAQTVTAQLEQDRIGLNPDPVQQSVEALLPTLTVQIDDRWTQDARLLDGNGSLTALQSSQTAWQSLADQLQSAQKDLSGRVSDLDKMLWTDLTAMKTKWQATYTASQAAKVPPEILQQINGVTAEIGETIKAVQFDQNQLYSMQNRVASQAARASAGLKQVNQALETARTRLLQRDHPPLWAGESLAQPGEGIVAQERVSLGAQITAMNEYLDQKVGTVVANLLLLGLLATAFTWLRKTIHQSAEQKTVLRQAARIFDLPIVTALLLALIGAGWIYPDPPPLLLALIGAVALIPAVIIIRRLIEPPLFPLLYATVLAYAYDQLRLVIRPGGVLSRFLIIIELIAVCVFLLMVLRSRKLATGQLETPRLKWISRTYLHVAFFVFVCAGFANVFGYIHLSALVANGMLQASYLAVVFYAGVRILDALAISALNVWPLSGLRMVRRNQDLLYRNTSRVIRWGAMGVWAYTVLGLFSLRQPFWQGIVQVLDTHVPWGGIKDPPTIGDVLAFPISVWAAFLLSRFIRFCLEEEVYPNLQVGRGIPYVASTMVHYGVVLVGFLVGLNAIKIDLSQFTLLVSAFGVGLGFGLQNIMNNFISGLILLFERPIKVGDTIQIDANTTGKVERIGIRASVILLTNGSELIMPNGNLISNPVTNWTLSNCERLIEIPVTVTSKVDPQHVLDLLLKTATAHASVLKNPAPKAVLVTFGATLVFRLQVWIDSEEDWMEVTSELSLAVNGALGAENITLA